MATDRDGALGGLPFRPMTGAAGLLSIAALVVWWPGCREYPAVTSREALSQLKMLYSACSARDEARLGEAVRRIDELSREGELSPAERAGFDKIIGLARAGRWEDAQKAAYKFAQDQVGRGHPAPPDHEHGHEHGRRRES